MMKTFASFVVSSLFVSLVGCGDDLAVELTEQQLAFPASCLEAGGGELPASGTQTLYAGNNEQQPWQAMCHTGDEFLPTSASMGSITSATGDQLFTEYAYLRIDPATLTLDLSDTTFATSNGGPIELAGVQVAAAPAGFAFSDDVNASAFGQLDITGSNFRVKTAFELVGPGAASSNVSVHRDDRWIESYVADCAAGPAGMPSMPAGLAGTALTVELVWAGPEAP